MTMVHTVEGVLHRVVHYHFDVRNDVLYLSLADMLDRDTYGEETDDGLVILRTIDDDRLAGLTVVSYWRRFGSGSVADLSMDALMSRAELLTERLTAA